MNDEKKTKWNHHVIKKYKCNKKQTKTNANIITTSPVLSILRETDKYLKWKIQHKDLRLQAQKSNWVTTPNIFHPLGFNAV